MGFKLTIDGEVVEASTIGDLLLLVRFKQSQRAHDPNLDELERAERAAMDAEDASRAILAGLPPEVRLRVIARLTILERRHFSAPAAPPPAPVPCTPVSSAPKPSRIQPRPRRAKAPLPSVPVVPYGVDAADARRVLEVLRASSKPMPAVDIVAQLDRLYPTMGHGYVKQLLQRHAKRKESAIQLVGYDRYGRALYTIR